MKRTRPFILIFFILISCDNQTEGDELFNKEDNQIESPTNGTITFIKEKVKDSFDLNLSIEEINLKSLKTFSSDFLKNTIANKKIQIGFPQEFNPEYPESFYFYQGKQFRDFYLLTFLHTDETCCTTLYGATFLNATDSLINMAVLAYKGGDGGWYGNQIANWHSENILNIIEFSEYDEDLDEMTNNSEIDSIWNEIELNKKGVFKLNQIKKISYFGDKLKM